MTPRHLSATLLLFLLLASGWLLPAPTGTAAPALVPDAFQVTPTDLGMAFVNSAEELRSPERVARGVASGAALDRFPFYWDRIERGPGQWEWSRHDEALRRNEAQGLGTLAILLGTAPHHFPRAARGMEPPPMPPIGGGPLRDAALEQEGAFRSGGFVAPGCSYAGIPPAARLDEPIFADGSDVPGAGKLVNSNNPWAYYVAQVVQRYRPGGTGGFHVRYWEVWNEADLCHFWGGTVEQMARMQKIAYLVIKLYDPEATVLWNGLALYGPKYERGYHFLNQFVGQLRSDPMAAAHNGFFDAAAVHQYSSVTHGYHNTRRVRAALAGTGWEGKPIWVTESGVPICSTVPDYNAPEYRNSGNYPGPICPSPYRATMEEQAAYVWQNIAYSRIAPGGGNGGPIFHFQLHDDGGNECKQQPPADAFGLITNEPGVPCVPHSALPRPGYMAFQLAARYLTNVEVLWADFSATWRRVAFYDPVARERRTMVWAIGGSDTLVPLPATSSGARRVALDGSEILLQPTDGAYGIAVPRATSQNQPNSQTYTIGGRPYLIIEPDTLPPDATIGELEPVSLSPFEVSWQVADLGSGMASPVEVWVQRDEEPWQPWLTEQATAGEVFFHGEIGHRYRFGIRATDRAGNQRDPAQLLASTLVTDVAPPATLTGQTVTMANQVAPWAPVAMGPFRGYADGGGRFRVPGRVGRWDLAVAERVLRFGQRILGDLELVLVVPPAHNALQNGDWEQGLAGWSQGGSSPMALQQWGDARDNVLRLASAFVPSPGVPGTDGSAGGNSTISQVVQVPPGSPRLVLLLRIESAETDGGNGSCSNPALLHDKFEIIVARDGFPADYILCQEIPSEWGFRFLDLSPYAGQRVTLIFNLYETSPERRTSAQLDMLLLGESPSFAEPRYIYFPVAR